MSQSSAAEGILFGGGLFFPFVPRQDDAGQHEEWDSAFEQNKRKEPVPREPISAGLKISAPERRAMDGSCRSRRSSRPARWVGDNGDLAVTQKYP